MALDPNLTYFTGDTHFGGFRNNDQEVIDAWNSVVPTGGTVCHLGDFTDGRVSKKGIDFWREISSKLNGNIIFILGNHDDGVRSGDIVKLPKFTWAGPVRRVMVKDPEGNVQRQQNESYQEIVLFHYPMRAWVKKSQGSWHLFGHMHGNLPPHDLSFDVGVDTHKFRPWTYQEVKDKMARLRKAGGLKQKREIRNYQ
jgi:calcineurin-like phosphoesterase family protein